MNSTHDVRMRGFQTRDTVEAALAWIDGRHKESMPCEFVSLEKAHARVASRDVLASLSVPRFDRAAMDGYAVIAEDTIGASPGNPVTLAIIQESLPGRAAKTVVASGTAVRIMTGGPIPRGATAVLPVEVTRPVKQGAADAIEVIEAVPEQKHIGRIGEDIAEGTIIVPAGTHLLPQHLGVLASAGLDQVEVVSRPRVRVIASGHEIVPAGQPLTDHQIYDANSPMLEALIFRDGGVLESLERVIDDRDQIEAALLRPGADIILVSGGSSVGAEDFAPQLVAKNGTLSIHGIAMRPSSPAGMGVVGDTDVYLLPGNPVSCLCAYDFFAGRAIRLLGNRPAAWPYGTERQLLERRIVSAIGRTDYCRVKRREQGVVPVAISGASMLSSITRADGFVVVPCNLEGYAAGSHVQVWWYDSHTRGQDASV